MGRPNDIVVLSPWCLLDGSTFEELAGRLSRRLQTEIPFGHVLHGVKTRAVAKRIDCDDVLFEIEEGPTPLAVVHLSWKKETDPRWPKTKLFPSWQQWVQDDMIPAHEEYESAQ